MFAIPAICLWCYGLVPASYQLQPKPLMLEGANKMETALYNPISVSEFISMKTIGVDHTNFLVKVDINVSPRSHIFP